MIPAEVVEINPHDRSTWPPNAWMAVPKGSPEAADAIGPAQLGLRPYDDGTRGPKRRRLRKA